MQFVSDMNLSQNGIYSDVQRKCGVQNPGLSLAIKKKIVKETNRHSHILYAGSGENSTILSLTVAKGIYWCIVRSRM